MRTPYVPAPMDTLLNLFGVAECRLCGTTIALGERRAGSPVDLCCSCRSLPSGPAAPMDAAFEPRDIFESMASLDRRERDLAA